MTTATNGRRAPHPAGARASRRQVLGTGMGIAAWLGSQGLARAAQGLGVVAAAPPGGPGTRVQHPDVLHWLVRHTTQGATLADVGLARTLGYTGWLEYQLAADAIDDSALDALLAPYSTLNMTGQELYTAYQGNSVGVQQELKEAVVLRAVHSKRQLLERLVEFWTDHFNIDHGGDRPKPFNAMKTLDDRTVVRAHALGRFQDMLHASARSAAMLAYLNNDTNVVGTPQENYAREVMELHTLGVTGPYTEADIVEVARCLTGWDYRGTQSGDYGAFAFRPNQHDNGAKVVLGIPIPAGGGIQDGITVLDMLGTHFTTARFLARKLTAWLLAPNPPQTVTDRVALKFVATGGDVRAMVREMFELPNVLEARAWEQPKLRRPFQFVTSLLRASGAAVADPAAILTELKALGHSPFDWPAPNGYPDSVETWGTSIAGRFTFASRLFSDQIPGCTVDTVALFAPLGGFAVPDGTSRIETVLGLELAADERAAVQTYLEGNPFDEALLREALALAASMPSSQYH